MLTASSSRCICSGIRSVFSIPPRHFATASTSKAHVLNKKADGATAFQEQEQDPATTTPLNPAPAPRHKKKTRILTADEQDRLEYLYSDGKNPFPQQILHLFPGLPLRSLIYRVSVLKGPSASRRRRWSPDEIERLLNLVASGRKPHELLGQFPNRTECAMESIVSRWRPGNSSLFEKKAASGDTQETTGRDGNTGKNSSRSAHGTISSSPSSTSVTIDSPLPWIPMQERRVLWTEAEDAVLKSLVQKAMNNQPDRWRKELSRLLSDPKEREGLDPSRSFAKSVLRLEYIQSQPFVSKRRWTTKEHELLIKAVSSQTGITLEKKPTRLQTSDSQGEHSPSTDPGQPPMEPSQSHLESLKDVNWRLVALEVGTKDYEQCRRRYILCGGNRRVIGYWSSKEFELFKQGVNQYGQDWKKIASVVGTRSPFQVRCKYLWLSRRSEQ